MMQKSLFLIFLLFLPRYAFSDVEAPDRVPIGAAIPTMPHIPGSWQPPASGQVKDGFMRANGAKVTDSSSPLVNQYLPNLTGGVYIKGGTSSSSTVTGSNSLTLSLNQLRNHLHVATHNHTNSAISGETTSHAHTADVDVTTNTPSVTINPSFRLRDWSGYPVRVRATSGIFDPTNSKTGSFANSDGVQTAISAAGRLNIDIDHAHNINYGSTTSGKQSANHTHTFDPPSLTLSTLAAGSNPPTAIVVEPKRISVVWVIRIK